MVCQSVARPSTAEYWHIGDTTMRLASVSLRIEKGENRDADMVRSREVFWRIAANSRRALCQKPQAARIRKRTRSYVCKLTPYRMMHIFAPDQGLATRAVYAVPIRPVTGNAAAPAGIQWADNDNE